MALLNSYNMKNKNILKRQFIMRCVKDADLTLVAHRGLKTS